MPLLAVALAVQTILCQTVWDGAGHGFKPGRIVVDGDKIREVGPQTGSPEQGAIDLGSAFCMPGLVDAHTHVTSYVEHKDDTQQIRRNWAVRNALETIEGGVTTARDMGDEHGDGVWIRDQIDAGKVQGPRLQVACDPIGPEPAHQKMTPDQLRELVREHARRGCDVIKLFATAGMTRTDRYLSRPQLVALVDEAHRLERKVAVHAVAHEACVDAVEAGADSVEHGPGVDAALARDMKRGGIALVPTLYILRYYLEDAPNIEFTAADVAQLEHAIGTVVEPFENGFPDVVRTGVTIAGGSDSFMKLHGKNANEMVWMVHAGLRPERALAAMTKVSAELMGWGDRVGTLAAGRYADVIGVDADPRKDITRMREVRFVMKGGTIVRP